MKNSIMERKKIHKKKILKKGKEYDIIRSPKEKRDNMDFFERNHKDNTNIVCTLMDKFNLAAELSNLTPENFYIYVDAVVDAVIDSTIPLENLRLDPAQVNNELIDYVKKTQYGKESLATLIAYTSNHQDYKQLSPYQKATLVLKSISDTFSCHGKKLTSKNYNFGMLELAKDVFANPTELKTLVKK